VIRVKICGIANLDDGRHALKCGADMLGFIFAESPRRVTPQQAYSIISALRDEGFATFTPVGVFVNAPVGDVISDCMDAGVSMAQLHGDETPLECRKISRIGINVIKSFRIRDRSVIETMFLYDTADYVLCDTYDPQRPGGTGQPFDYSMVASVSHLYRLILAGGLTPDNVVEAISIVHPWGVDVSSGVEASPGRKDPAKVEAFIRNARAAIQ